MVSVLLVNGREPQGAKSQPLSLEAFRDHELSSDREEISKSNIHRLLTAPAKACEKCPVTATCEKSRKSHACRCACSKLSGACAYEKWQLKAL